MFRGLRVHHQEVKTVLYSIWYHHACRWPSGAQVERKTCLGCIISLLYASKCFEHYVFIIRRSIFYYTASGIITLKQVSGPAGGRAVFSQPVHRTATYKVW